MDTIQAKSVDSHNNKSEKYEVRIEESLTVPGEKPTKLKHNKIFFVGCWNRRDANNNNYCTTAVLNDIKNSESHYDEIYDFGIVLGDNIYPDEANYVTGEKLKSKTKVFTPEKMHTGITAFNELGYPLHIVLGNHDAENCDMLNMQAQTQHNWRFDGNLYSVLYDVDDAEVAKKYTVKLIVIDTNVLQDYIPERKERQDAQLYKDLNDTNCNIPENINVDPTSYYELLADMLKPENNDDISLIVIAGHQPLFTAKEKDGQTKSIVMLFVNDFMLRIKLLKENNVDVVYLCADLHAFMDATLQRLNSSGDVDCDIRQIAVGTGGASPDPFKKEYIELITDPKNYPTKNNMRLAVNNVANSYGYGSFDILAYLKNNNEGFNYRQNYLYAYDAVCFPNK